MAERDPLRRGGVVADHVHIGWLSAFLSQALIGGVGSVLVFVPQIVLLFILIALRLVLAHAPLMWAGLCLALALAAHGVDLAGRWRR